MINVTCCNRDCGVDFGIPEHIERQARRDAGRRVVCPNGHGFVYQDSEPDRLRKEIERLNAQVVRKQEYVESLERENTTYLKRVRYWKGIAHRKGRK